MFAAIAPKSAAFSRALARALWQQGEELIQRLDGAAGGRAKDVHRARVASRRLREVLAVLTAVDMPGARRVRRRVRRLTRQLGEVRELDVMLDELATAARDRAWKRHLVVPWRLQLGRARARRRLALAREREKFDVGAFGKASAKLLRVLTRATSNEPWRAAFSRRLSARAAGVVKAIAACGTDYDPARLHRLRVAVKKLRYALELAPQTPRRRALLDELTGLQQQLGHWHDLHVLADAMAQRVPAPAATGPTTYRSDVIAAIGDLEGECRRLHAAVLLALPTLSMDATALALGARRRVISGTLGDVGTSHASHLDTRRRA